MSDKNNENQLDRLSPEELFDRFSDDSFSSLLEGDSVWGQNLPPDSPLNGGEGADDAWGRDGFGDSADPFGLTDISSAFGHLSSNTEETHTAEEAGKTLVETDSKVSDSGQYSAGADSRVSGPDLYPSQAEDTDITDESSLIRDSLHKDIPSEAETAAFEEILSSDEQVSEVRGSGIPLGCGGAPEYQESSDSTDAENVRARIQKKEESEKEEPEKEEPEKEEPEKEEPEKEELEKKRISRPIHILLALCILLAFLVLVLSSIPKKEIEVIEEEDKVGLFTEAVVSMYVADYYAVIDVSDIDGLIQAFLSSNKQWAGFSFGDRENYKEIGADTEEIDLRVHIEDEIKNQKDYVSGNRHRDVVDLVISHIESNYADEDLSLQTLADLVHFSPSHLSVIFSQQTGETLSKYLINYRIEKAKEALCCTSKKSSQIAEETGYRDPHYFSYMFKKVTGMTPTQYRESRTGDELRQRG